MFLVAAAAVETADATAVAAPAGGGAMVVGHDGLACLAACDLTKPQGTNTLRCRSSFDQCSARMLWDALHVVPHGSAVLGCSRSQPKPTAAAYQPSFHTRNPKL